jgi:transposase
LPAILEDAENELSFLMCSELQRLYDNIVELDKHIAGSDKIIKEIFSTNEQCKRIAEIEGVVLQI